MPVKLIAGIIAVASGIAVLNATFGDQPPRWTLAVSVPVWMASIVLLLRDGRGEQRHADVEPALAPTGRISPPPAVLDGWELAPLWDGADAMAAAGEPPIMLLHGRADEAPHPDALIALTAGVHAGWRLRGTAADLSWASDLPDGASAIPDTLRSADLDAEVSVGSGWLAVAIPWSSTEDHGVQRIVDCTRRIIDQVTVVPRRVASPA